MNLSIQKTKLYFSMLAFSFGAIQFCSAQCAPVIKQAIQKLTVYTHTGQTNSATISAGNKVEMHLEFYRGLNYKLQFGADAALGQYTFRILDENKQELYTYDGTTGADYFTFLSNSSQELTVEISAVDKTKKGCVTVVVGMQAPKTANSIRNL